VRPEPSVGAVQASLMASHWMPPSVSGITVKFVIASQQPSGVGYGVGEGVGVGIGVAVVVKYLTADHADVLPEAPTAFTRQ